MQTASYLSTPVVAPVIFDYAPGCAEPRPDQVIRQLTKSRTDFVMGSDPAMIDSLVSNISTHVRNIAGCDETFASEVEIALTEALLNSVYHGNLELDSELRIDDENRFHIMAEQRCHQFPYCHRRVYLSVTLSQFHVVISIRDEGPGFNVNVVADPRSKENLGKPCGRGILMMRHCMTRVAFNNAGNQVTMVKRLDSISGRRHEAKKF